jgi:hypothetical protein
LFFVEVDHLAFWLRARLKPILHYDRRAKLENRPIGPLIAFVVFTMAEACQRNSQMEKDQVSCLTMFERHAAQAVATENYFRTVRVLDNASRDPSPQ